MEEFFSLIVYCIELCAISKVGVLYCFAVHGSNLLGKLQRLYDICKPASIISTPNSRVTKM